MCLCSVAIGISTATTVTVSVSYLVGLISASDTFGADSSLLLISSLSTHTSSVSSYPIISDGTGIQQVTFEILIFQWKTSLGFFDYASLLADLTAMIIFNEKSMKIFYIGL